MIKISQKEKKKILFFRTIIYSASSSLRSSLASVSLLSSLLVSSRRALAADDLAEDLLAEDFFAVDLLAVDFEERVAAFFLFSAIKSPNDIRICGIYSCFPS
jgi:hypothetical protein